MALNYRKIDKIVSDLKLHYKDLTEFQLLSIAVQIQRNEIIKTGLNVKAMDSLPTSLEAIAIQLGFSDKRTNETIPESINQIVGVIAEKS